MPQDLSPTYELEALHKHSQKIVSASSPPPLSFPSVKIIALYNANKRIFFGGFPMGERFFGQYKWPLFAFVAATSLLNIGFSNTPTATPQEALMLRRITEYWKDGDYSSAKVQILYFLEKNPDTTLRDHLNAMLGDLYFQEKNFRQALATYDLIGDRVIREKTFFNHLQASFETRDYLSVIEKGENFLKMAKAGENERQLKVRYLLAEACFRQALKCKDMGEKVLYLKMAKPHYKILTQTKYSDRVLFPLAEIHRLLREDARAASLYLNLAEKYPEHRERFLFQAGILQIKEDKNAAIKTFNNVYEMGGKRSKLAAFNQLILIYQNEKYEEFLSFYQKVSGLMPEQKLPLLQFYEGRCHYFLGDYQQAVMPLENFITTVKGKSKELKTALLLLVNCSRYLKDITLLERTLYSFKNTFPKEMEVPKIYTIHAQMCRENGNFTQALTDLKILLTDYPGFEDSESVAYDYALILGQTDQWTESREKFLSFLEQYPHSERKNSAWRHLLNCCMEELKQPEQANFTSSKEIFVSILQRALQEEKVLNEKEQEQYQLVLIKCLCELERYDSAVPMLSHYINDVVDPTYLSEAHLLMAICHQKMSHDISFFIQSAEKALGLNPKLQENEILHLELYNAYLAKAFASEDGSNKNYFFSHAAEHLFSSYAWKDRSIKLDNYLWLVNNYYQLAKKGQGADFEKAKTLFQDLLGIEEGKETLNISSDSLFLESEVLKFAHLLELNSRPKDQVRLLEMLVRKQEEHPQLPWKLKKRSVLELAKAYEKGGQYQHALNSYQFLVKAKDQTSSLVTNTARLHLSKLEYNLLKPQQRNSETPEMLSILHTLKDLQIQKKLHAEPVHLEAALQYAEIRSSLSDQATFAKTALFFYRRMAEDFHASEDPIGEAYTQLRGQNPEKNALFSAYMRYLDAQMLHCEAQIARDEKNSDKAAQYQEDALSIVNELLSDEKTLKPYLLGRVRSVQVELTK